MPIECASASAGKKLLDTRHPAYKTVTGVRGRVLHYWKGITLPYPEPGIRLVRQGDIGAFDVQLTTLRAELDEAVQRLDAHYAELKSAARKRLGKTEDLVRALKLQKKRETLVESTLASLKQLQNAA